MSVQNFKPEVFSRTLLTQRNEKAVALPLCDTEFEKDFKAGDRVHISGVGSPTTHDLPSSGDFVDGNGNPIPAEAIEDEGLDFYIDQRKFVLFKVSDLDKLQMNKAAVSRFMSQYSDEMVALQDGYIYGIAQVGAGLQYKAPSAISSQNAYGFFCDAIANLRSVHSSLSPNDITFEVHPQIANVISKALAYQSSSNDLEHGSTGHNIDGVKIYQSNNCRTLDASGNLVPVVKTTDSGFSSYVFHCLVRTKRAIAFAEPKKIDWSTGKVATAGTGDYTSGWYFYGSKVIYPDECVDVAFSIGTEVNV